MRTALGAQVRPSPSSPYADKLGKEKREKRKLTQTLRFIFDHLQTYTYLHPLLAIVDIVLSAKEKREKRKE